MTPAMETSKVGRRLARRRVVQSVYAMSFHAYPDTTEMQRAFRQLPLDDEAEEHRADDANRSADALRREQEDLDFAQHLATGVYLCKDEIDQILRRFSKHWRIERIARVELSILRLGVYEMLHEPDIPLRVSINEAVELSREFADDQSFPFVNGILDAVAKAVSHGEFGIHKQF